MTNKHLLNYFSFLLIFNIESSAMHWDYQKRGPDTWSDDFALCSGQNQSPINILTACTEFQQISPFEFTSNYNVEEKFFLKNIGTTIVGTIEDSNVSSSFRLSAGGLNGSFEFVNFHLHWGKNYRSGSEHQINGRKYAGEIHFVHFNRQTSQLAVLAFFMETSPKTHSIHRNQWRKTMSIAQKLRGENTSTTFDLNLSTLFGENLHEFWRYEGSLTTPPCTEGVIWTVFRQSIVFTDEQIEKLRENILLEGHRSPQPLYNRIVYRNYPNESFSSIPDYNRCQFEQSIRFSPIFFILSLILIGVFSVKIVFLNETNKNY